MVDASSKEQNNQIAKPLREDVRLKNRLAEHIRALCAKAIDAPEYEWEPILTDLRLALHEHVEELRELAVATVGQSSKAGEKEES